MISMLVRIVQAFIKAAQATEKGPALVGTCLGVVLSVPMVMGTVWLFWVAINFVLSSSGVPQLSYWVVLVTYFLLVDFVRMVKE